MRQRVQSEWISVVLLGYRKRKDLKWLVIEKTILEACCLQFPFLISFLLKALSAKSQVYRLIKKKS